MAAAFYNVAAPALTGTELMRQADFSQEPFQLPPEFFHDDYCLGFTVGAFSALMTQTAASRWSSERQTETFFHACHVISNIPETFSRYWKVKENVLPNEGHPLNQGHEEGFTLMAVTLQVMNSSEYDTNPLIRSAVEQVDEKGVVFTENKHQEVCFHIMTNSLRTHVLKKW